MTVLAVAPTSLTWLILALSLSSILMIFILIWAVKDYNSKSRRAQEILSDKELIEFIDGQTDKIVNTEILSRQTGLSKSQARNRLTHLYWKGLLKVLYSNSFKSFYKLRHPVREPQEELHLSKEPFMTLEDLLSIFKAYDYKVTLQEICLATGLPIKVILRELKYFSKEKVITKLTQSDNYGMSFSEYMLNEPYRSNPDAFLKLENANFELREIYKSTVDKDFV